MEGGDLEEEGEEVIRAALMAAKLPESSAHAYAQKMVLDGCDSEKILCDTDIVGDDEFAMWGVKTIHAKLINKYREGRAGMLHGGGGGPPATRPAQISHTQAPPSPSSRPLKPHADPTIPTPEKPAATTRTSKPPPAASPTTSRAPTEDPPGSAASGSHATPSKGSPPTVPPPAEAVAEAEAALARAVAECLATAHSLGEGHPDLTSWTQAAMMAGSDAPNDFHSTMDPTGKTKLAPHEPRASAERRCMELVVALDKARAPTQEARDEQMVGRGVTLRVLRELLAEARRAKPGVERMATWQVVRDVVQPATRRRRCRYVELLRGLGVGRATVFCSHTWGAPFEDLVAAVELAVGGESEGIHVWVDILAVRQWPGNGADLAFGPVVRDTEALVLVAQHLDSVAAMDFKARWPSLG